MGHYPSAACATLSDTGTAFGAITVAGPGTGPYDPQATRWGDYSFAVLDTTADTVWLATEYVPPKSSQTSTRQRNWGTRVLEVALRYGIPLTTKTPTNAVSTAPMATGVGMAFEAAEPSMNPMTRVPGLAVGCGPGPTAKLTAKASARMTVVAPDAAKTAISEPGRWSSSLTGVQRLAQVRRRCSLIRP